MRTLLLACVALLVVPAAVHSAEDSAIGRQVESFELPDYNGRTIALDQFADRPLVAIVFLGIDCPLVKLYGPRLAELSAQFGDQVQFVGVNSNVHDTITQMAAYANRAGIDFPLLKDAGNVLADRLGATRTPEVLLIDAERVVRYHGRIDDQYGAGSVAGYAKYEVQRHDLAEAIEELLADKPVSVPSTKVVGCLIGRASRGEPGGDVTYTKHIVPLLQNRCLTCHREGEVGPFALTDYDQVFGWADMIREVVNQELMPPWFANPAYGRFKNDARLSQAEKDLINAWVDNGCPEGDASDLPPPRQYVDGWQIDTPEQIIPIPKPVTIPAKGVLPYKYVIVDPGWKEDKWIQAAEVRPQNRSVVHHILVGLLSPVSLWNKAPGAGGPASLTSYVPGSNPHVYDEGMAVYVPAGTRLVFEIHYTPNGVEQTDQSYLGVVFADPATVRKRAFFDAAENREFTIPAYASNHQLEARHEFKTDQLLLSMSPHMHVRGKAFRFEAIYPDGARETLLDVPRYDFNWQLRYELAEPKPMPAGTTLLCTGWYDNSEDNPANPDPSAELRFGWQTWDEMLGGFYTSVSVAEDAQETIAAAERDATTKP